MLLFIKYAIYEKSLFRGLLAAKAIRAGRKRIRKGY